MLPYNIPAASHENHPALKNIQAKLNYFNSVLYKITANPKADRYATLFKQDSS